MRHLSVSVVAHGSRRHAVSPADPVAVVTAESRNEVVAVDLRTGGIRARVRLPVDPENVVVGGTVVVVSARAGTVTTLDPQTLRVSAELRGFSSPHIPALAPGGQDAYVTDDRAGTLTAVRLRGPSVLARLSVGAGAHHLTFSPNGRRVWIALGESARTVVIVDIADPAHPRVLRRFDPGFAAHDMQFSPSGGEVWISAAGAPDVTVLGAGTRRVLFRVPVGPPPQHIAFDHGSAYLTSGYGGSIEKVDPATGRILARARTPYGSFELDAGGGYVVTSSLFRGTLAVFDRGLRLRRIVPVAPSTRDVAIVAVRR
jgi:DNA-binding beta-propeller fold protein YncE